MKNKKGIQARRKGSDPEPESTDKINLHNPHAFHLESSKESYLNLGKNKIGQYTGIDMPKESEVNDLCPIFLVKNVMGMIEDMSQLIGRVKDFDFDTDIDHINGVLREKQNELAALLRLIDNNFEYTGCTIIPNNGFKAAIDSIGRIIDQVNLDKVHIEQEYLEEHEHYLLEKVKCLLCDLVIRKESMFADMCEECKGRRL